MGRLVQRLPHCLFCEECPPSADARQLRERDGQKPPDGPPRVRVIEQRAPSSRPAPRLVGNYAIRIKFSDGHDTGLYSWDYLREIDPKKSQKRRVQEVRSQESGEESVDVPPFASRTSASLLLGPESHALAPSRPTAAEPIAFETERPFLP